MFTAQRNASGLIEVHQDGNRIATGTEDILKKYSLTPEQVQQPKAAPAPKPDQQLSPLQNPVPASTLTPPDQVTLPDPEAPAMQQQFFGSLASEVQNARTAVEQSLKSRQEEVEKRLTDLKAQEKEILAKDEALTSPFRAEIETAERERLHINENFEANQRLVGELEGLVAEANSRLPNELNRFASRSSIEAGYTRTLSDITARAGLIQSVIAARDGQIAQAYTMIDRTVSAIAADRKDQLAYYDLLLTLNREKQISLDGEGKKIAEEERDLLKGDLARIEKTADMIREAMLDPNLAQTYAEAGVSLLDTPEEINQKLATYAYAKEVRDLSNDMALHGYASLAPGQTPPAGAHVVTITDSKGQAKRFYAKPAATGSGSGGVLTPLQAFDRELKLANDFEKYAAGTRQAIAGIQLVNEGYNEAAAALKNGKPLNAQSQAVIVGFNKLIDPTSVVRESEYARTPEGASFINRLDAYRIRFMQGGAGLNAAELQGIRDTALALLRGYQAQQLNFAERTKQQAEQLTTLSGGLAGDLSRILTPDVIDLMNNASSTGPGALDIEARAEQRLVELYPEHGREIETLIEKYPDLSNHEILQVLGYN